MFERFLILNYLTVWLMGNRLASDFTEAAMLLCSSGWTET